MAGRAAAVQPDEVWVGDITYIRLGAQSFGYLSLLLDLYSRRIVGWEFSESMEEGLVLATLREAIISRAAASSTTRTGAGSTRGSSTGRCCVGRRCSRA